MDVLAELLRGLRARDAFLLRTVLDPPWSLRIRDAAPLSVTTVVRGNAWVVPAAGTPTALGPGDVAVLRGPDPYTVADRPETPPQVVIHPGQRCTTLGGRDLADSMTLGLRTWGTRPDAAAVLLTGTYTGGGAVGAGLLAALPPLVVLSADDAAPPVVPLLAAELHRDRPGQEAVLDRLLDLLVIAALRRWFDRPDAGAPGWYRAYADPVVGLAVRLVQDDPARPWTVARLAAAGGVSRAAFARRFAAVVGEPPMAFVTGWRLALAADLLRDTELTLTAVARRVGYGSPFALSAAFKRAHGISPHEYRAAR
ncbi:AraC family transcriptional regulator [Micromonospora auratinigra]|uniref:Transcriptional regulator, AraC family n=1 Tax=Micromonospora auratinigra TaxID=261654 RepID=A0A1A8ZCU9_9ACTN|nr:AraC family transcriptional regulator [Micromonospora auratinigra]SBT41828.1 transcriptional regulator, AraC family [Micromonospora auratinigra]